MDNVVETKFNKLFASPSEKFVCTLGNNFAENYLAKGSLENGFAILSDKRVYFKGICYISTGKNFVKRNEERIVDVKDVTGTGFIHFKAILMRIIAIILTMSVVLLTILIIIEPPNNDEDNVMLVFLILIMLGIFFWFMYFKNLKTLFEISFAGGKIAFDTTWLNEQEIQDFQRNLRLTKDAYEEHQQAQATPVVVSAPQASVSDELKKYKDLLDGGVITEEEFITAKSRLLGSL
ncbi:MAG: SHOCT domain-containing protein [Defluviitaleaceae bacterium]|nr:SHOCT domain-containing protein [Defluviitaleaceae bacterium]